MTLNRVSDVLARLDLSILSEVNPLDLQVGPVRIRLRCNEPLRAVLAAYFEHITIENSDTDLEICVLSGQSLDPAPNWIDWAREPGKTGLKDAIFDLSDGRLVFKRRTGVTFLQSNETLIAFGPVEDNANQIINFVNNQILNTCLRANWQICHAAAVTNGEHTLAIAGLSGGGKSTSILRMMDIPGTSFVTNDRLMICAQNPLPHALGLPKHPRINPGTILHNPRLHGMLSPERLAQIAAMPVEELWNFEEKYDLVVPQIYGAGRLQLSTTLTEFWVLNWQRNSAQPTTISDVSIANRPDLLGAIMKSPGPFYAGPTGQFETDCTPLNPDAYIQALQNVRIREVAGRIDFDALMNEGYRLLGNDKV